MPPKKTTEQKKHDREARLMAIRNELEEQRQKYADIEKARVDELRKAASYADSDRNRKFNEIIAKFNTEFTFDLDKVLKAPLRAKPSVRGSYNDVYSGKEALEYFKKLKDAIDNDSKKISEFISAFEETNQTYPVSDPLDPDYVS